ncbi:MAG: ester cyclase [Anaerolineae bacterium]|nr:ester cyclase [Anaerolineae bacterium]
MSAENKAIVRRLIETVQNGHHLDQLEAFFDPHFVNHLESPDEASDLNAVDRARLVFRQLFTAFPDLHVTIQQQVAEGDKVVTYKTFHGTHQGDFMGVAPTGRPITFAVIDILRLDQGKVVEHWAIQDRLALMQQVGMLPVPDRP